MANNLKTAINSRNTELTALAALANTGYIRIYDSTGTGQPTTPETAVTTQVLLAELRFNATAFGAASAGVITAGVITSGTAGATGTATWFRALKSDGTTVLWDGSVGTATADLILNTVSIVSGATVAISAMTYTLPQ